ncbi:enhanced serine sensitivity protein SseB C-terminal domain-containing protein [Pseudomonas sp. B28(2017)]|uniref:enhanced serine sensitivity protein SseB C-terminal domain-containing protein n=1 Tax=Pseudomonas sp. B28(2017) TaxID=1981730 RepID=UPI002115921F|nr:enhanced serine sensitivity protein SseB C-terminal domain-containing protein [Pseudomonas sp. B28(2017)]
MSKPSNDLERKLMLAADNPANRPEFYKALMASDVYVIGFTDSEGEEIRTIPTGAKLSIVNWEKNDGTPIIPFFTSLEALQRVLKEESKYVALPAKSFFEMTLGSFLMLNPASSYGKEFFPDEIHALLETGVNHAPQTRVVQKETKVLLGQPANYPSEMVSALTSLLAKHSAVKAAYLCLMHDPSTSEKPSLVVGFDGDKDLAEAMKEAGSVAADTAPKGEVVDFVVLKKGESGFSNYMLKSVKPFYERTWGAKLRSLFSPGKA